MAGEDKSERERLAHRGKRTEGEKKSRASCEILDCRVLLALPSDPTRSFRPFKPLNCRQTTVSTNAKLCTLLSCMGCLVSIFQFHCDWNWIEKRDTSSCELYYVYFAFRREDKFCSIESNLIVIFLK